MFHFLLVTKVFCAGAMGREVITNAESRGLPGRGRGKGRSRRGAATVWYKLPKAQSGGLCCGTDGNSSDRSPRLPKRIEDGGTWNDAMDNLRTIDLPFDVKAGIGVSSALAPW